MYTTKDLFRIKEMLDKYDPAIVGVAFYKGGEREELLGIRSDISEITRQLRSIQEDVKTNPDSYGDQRETMLNDSDYLLKIALGCDLLIQHRVYRREMTEDEERKMYEDIIDEAKKRNQEQPSS